MDDKKNNQHRRKFLFWGFGAAALVAVSPIRRLFRKKENSAPPVKMLAQDGTLVEVDVSRITGKHGKATTAELQQWVKR